MYIAFCIQILQIYLYYFHMNSLLICFPKTSNIIRKLWLWNTSSAPCDLSIHQTVFHRREAKARLIMQWFSKSIVSICNSSPCYLHILRRAWALIDYVHCMPVSILELHAFKLIKYSINYLVNAIITWAWIKIAHSFCNMGWNKHENYVNDANTVEPRYKEVGYNKTLL